MNNKTYIQIFICLSILAIVSIIYIYYFKNTSLRSVDSNKIDESVKKSIVVGNDDIITEMFYISEDNKGNSYEIKSEYGFINPDKSNFILMDKVNAVINLTNGERILISSDKAQYNDNNNDTTFTGSVEMIYLEHKVNSDNMDLSFKEKTATLYDEVRYESILSNLRADKIFIDFLNKNTKILMNDDSSNILVRSIINDGNN